MSRRWTAFIILAGTFLFAGSAAAQVPVLGLLNPSSASVGTQSVYLTIYGSNFNYGAVVLWSGAALPTAFVNSNQLNATVAANYLTVAGQFAVNVQNADRSQSNALYFTVLGSPVSISTTTLSQAAVGTPYSFAFTASGGTPPYVWTIADSLPAGFTLSPDGILAGTPQNPGDFTFTVRLADTTQAAVTRQFVLHVAPPPLSIKIGSPLPAGTAGLAYTQTFTAEGGRPPYRWAAAQLPLGLTLNATTGVLNGTPSVKGNFSFVVQVTDSGGLSATKTFALTIAVPPLAIATEAPLFNGTVGAFYAQPFSATGGTPPYTWSVTGDVPGLAIDTNTGALKGTPSTTGSFPITVQVADTGGLTSTKAFTLTVEAPKLTITTPSPLASGTVGAAYSQRFSAAGGTPPYTWVIISGGPSGLALDGNALAGTPTAPGAFTLTVQARDTAGLTAAKTFNVQINPAALSIVTGTQLVAAMAGQAYNVQLTAAGGTPPYTWSETGTPDGLRLDPATGLLSGMPKAPGSFAIAIRVTDTARATVLGLFRISIGVPDLPVLSVPGLPAVADAAGQYGVGLELDSPYPLAMSGQLVLSFAPDAGGGDSTIQFSTGGRTADFNIPANETKAVFTVPDLGIQTGTVAGTIQLTARLNYGGADVTPAPAPSWSTRVERAAPVIRTAKLVRSATGLEVQITGFCTAREVTQAVLRFTAASGSLLQTAEYTLPLEDAFAKWFQDPASVKYGSQFTFTQPFNLQGDPNAVSLESVTLSNRLGNVSVKP